jgi:hypothetical protein
MTAKASQSEAHVACHANDNLAVERAHPPGPLWFAVMVVVMNCRSRLGSTPTGCLNMPTLWRRQWTK